MKKHKTLIIVALSALLVGSVYVYVRNKKKASEVVDDEDETVDTAMGTGTIPNTATTPITTTPVLTPTTPVKQSPIKAVFTTQHVLKAPLTVSKLVSTPRTGSRVS